MKKRILSLALALVMSLALAAPAFAAEESWKEFTMEYGYIDLTFSAAKTKNVTVKSDYDPAAQSVSDQQHDIDAVLVTLKQGSTVSVRFNRNITSLSGNDLKSALAMCYIWGEDETDMPAAEAVVGKDCQMSCGMFIEDAASAGTYACDGFGYFISSGSIREDWGLPGEITPGIPSDGKLYLLQADQTPAVPATGTAYASTQNVLVDGEPVEFQCYALKDANGYDTNYIKVRDLAYVLNGTAAQFNVGWDGSVNLETKKAYASNGSEMNTPFSGNRAYQASAAETKVDGAAVELESIVLNDDNGGGYTYYKLRDLGAALGFTVDWSAEKGVYIETK